MAPEKRAKLRVLIVDDSAFMRMAIRSVLSRDPEIEIVGTANNGADGVSRVLELKPDIVTMDIEMPVMDGITAVREIMGKLPTRVIMVSTLTREGATATFDALEAGAVDYISKGTSDSGADQKGIREELLFKVKAAASSPFGRKNALTCISTQQRAVEAVRARPHAGRPDYVGIGASTGGPVALQEVLSRVPAGFPRGIMVVIHMPKAFTGPFAERLNGKCALKVKEAVDGDLLLPGQVLVAPGGRHTTLVRKAAGIAVQTVPTDNYPQYVYVPSVDLMMTSLADASKAPVLGVILTGMGSDGLKGMRHLKEKGGSTLVQDQATSTIYGMPKACIDAGIADEVISLEQIGAEIGRLGA
ncbi:MAG TPA: chemotaxis response regulator protein-glutamate methylesterase [Geobacteraceae bacterium]|nr:chemotaxis response regulator protein-glutamate methylesterase [Geobacteraceae bacterium]